MKREILFRGKAIMNTFSINGKEAKIKIGDWVYGSVIPFDDGIDLIYERDPNNPQICGCHGIDVDHNTVGQFTGLHDKDGKEIYEGDIVKCGDFIYKVVYESKRFASFGLRREGDMFMHYFGEAMEAKQCEVIGNIYE